MNKLTTSLQESVLTLIVMNDVEGGIAAGLIDVELFEPPYDDIVKKAIQYRKRFKKAPGNSHIDDIFDPVLSDKKHRSRALYTHVLGAIIEQAKGLNPEYVLSRVSEFMDEQNTKASLLEAADRLQRGGDDALTETKSILKKALQFNPKGLEKGIYLSDQHNVDLLMTSVNIDYLLGIKEFDHMGFGLTRGRVMGFTSPPSRGKSWSCVHVGIMALLQGAKVMHISLEMDETQVIPRYLRRLFAIAKRKEKYRRTKFDLDELGRVIGFDSRLTSPKLAISDPGIEKIILRKMRKAGSQLKRLHFKSFPTKSLSHAGLVAYLDQVEQEDGFMPDVLILDYPKLMKLPRGESLRIQLGEQMEMLRGYCGERHMAGYFPFQSNRAGAKVKLITAENIGEDYSLAQTVDDHLTYNQTSAEEELGLARLYVDKARSDRKHYTVLITQDYETGQFIRQSAMMPTDFWSLLKQETGSEENDSES